jgi:putative membrane protein
MRLDKALIWLHVTGNLFWIGGLVAVAVVLLAKSHTPKIRGEMGLKIYLALAVPGFVLSFLAGGGRLLMETALYLKQPWMHAKLLFALIAIVLHHIIGGRAKKMASGDAENAGPTKVLLAVFAVSAVLAAFFVVMQIPGRSSP